MKKIFTLVLLLFFSVSFVSAKTDKYSAEYLQSKKHFSLTRCLAEHAVKKSLKKALKKQTGSDYDVKFSGYNLSSIKKGIFKSIEIEGNDVTIQDINVNYINIKSVSDYNYIDYTKNPVVFKSDMVFDYNLLLSDDAINTALKDTDYMKVIAKVNSIAQPFFVIKGVRTKIKDNKMYIITDYNLPIATTKDRSFVAQSDFEVVNGVIKAKNVSIDTSYGNLGLNKVANLINYLNPLEFTIKEIGDEVQKATIENVNIVDNRVKVDGKIYVKGESKK